MSTLSTIAGQDSNNLFVMGKLLDSQSNEPLIFATIAVRIRTNETFLTGGAADSEGNFKIRSLKKGIYSVEISALGYEKMTLEVDLKTDTDLGNILLQPKTAVLEEVIIAGERVKAKKDPDRTIYFMNEKIYQVSNTGTDMLSYIPGIKIDLMKNISINGNTNIKILVDGKERDKNFMDQLDPERIDRVEIINSPGTRYDATISGVVNIILKEKSGPGFNGHIFVEVPVSRSIIYSFPGYSINYSSGKLDLFTSYTGEFSYFDIVESDSREINNESGLSEVKTKQFVRQKDWSHIFHLGADYKLNKSNQFSLYSYINPFSREFDGNVEYRTAGNQYGDKNLNYFRNDDDRNISSLHSVWFRHGFDKQGSELTFDMTYSTLRASNGTNYTYNGLTNELNGNYSSLVKPFQNSVSIRLDYTMPFSEKLKIDAGLKVRLQKMNDRQTEGFNYFENVFAGYGIISYTIPDYTFIAGLRSENSEAGLKNSVDFSHFNILPQLSVTRKFTNKQTLELSYSSTLYRPNIYELNPNAGFSDPFSLSLGNPGLESEITHKLKLGWSKKTGENFITSDIFYEAESNSINRYSEVTNNGLVETHVANLGSIRRIGAQFSGSFKVLRNITLNQWLRVYNMNTDGNDIAELKNIPARHRNVVETSISAIAAFRHAIALSLQFQYSSPVIDMQSDYFSDPLWMISVEKSFLKKFKAGVVTALPFTGSFTYHGNNTNTCSLSNHSEGNLQLPVFPVWFRLRYQFHAGEKGLRNIQKREEIINGPKKGF